MAQKSHGSRHGTRKKFSKDTDTTLTVNQHIKEFEEGDSVRIQFNPSVQSGRAHSRFHGRAAKVTGSRGNAVELEIKDGGTKKTLYLDPVHLEETE